MSPQFVKRLRGASLSTVPPSPTATEFNPQLAKVAARLIYKSPLPSKDDLPLYVLNAAAFPDTKEVDYDRLLPYVLARLPDEEELIGGKGYEVVFFAGGEDRGAHEPKKGRPGFSWTVQAYSVLSRAMRKRLQKLYMVHERKWVKVVSQMFSTIVSPKFRRKVVHLSSLSALALHLPIQDLLIPPSAYYRDRKISPTIYVPAVSGRRAFGASRPLPTATDGSARLPRVLRETTSFVLAPENIKTEGLFRVNARAITLEVLKEAYDRAQKFIVWREGKFVMTFHQWKEGFGDVTVNDVNEVDGYPVFAAAGLIKLWYSDLQEPIFPEASYSYLDRVYKDGELTHDSIMDLIGEASEWSHISKTHRQVVRMHLLPTLSAISKHPENKMSPKALAVCFAPGLLHGSDPLQDTKMCSIINRIFEYAIEQWDQGLQERCGMDESKFRALLALPKAPEDREDPLDTNDRRASASSEHQTHGILLVDHHSTTSEEEPEDAEGEKPPPLPPRASIDSSALSRSSVDSQRPDFSAPIPPHRKPVPARMSTSLENKPENLPVARLSLDSGKDFEAIEPSVASPPMSPASKAPKEADSVAMKPEPTPTTTPMPLGEKTDSAAT